MTTIEPERIMSVAPDVSRGQAEEFAANYGERGYDLLCAGVDWDEVPEVMTLNPVEHLCWQAEKREKDREALNAVIKKLQSGQRKGDKKSVLSIIRGLSQ